MMTDLFAVWATVTAFVFVTAVVIMLNPEEFMRGRTWLYPQYRAEWRRPIARVALLCWAWPLLLLAGAAIGLRWLWRAAR